MSKKYPQSPFTYDLNFAQPKLYDFKNKELTLRYYVNYMLNRTQEIFKYNNLPDTIPHLYIERYLQRNGNCCIAEHNDKLYVFFGGLGGEPNEYYMPTKYIVANPYLNLSKEYTIGEDCVLIRNDSEMLGLLPICSRYATLLLENDLTMLMETYNRRIPTMAAVHSDNEKIALDEMMKQIIKGDISIAFKEGFDELFRTNPYSAQANQMTDLIEFHQYCKGAWYQELGLQASFNMKREAISESEASMNDDVMIPLIDNMLRCRKDSILEVNKMFGTNITVELNSAWKDIADERELTLDVMETELEPEVHSSEPPVYGEGDNNG